MNSIEQAFGVYIHWPFCLSKCPYCDFNSHVRDAIDQARWQKAYLAEIDHWATETEGATIATIFFGGGTPSLMQPATVAAILDAIARHWRVAPDVEITIEANPTSVEAGRFRGYRAAGVNRVSLGVQALNDRALAELGRLHSAREALDAVGIARGVFDRVSFDLIYARPQQTPQDWGNELKTALAEAGEHLSLYQLTIEPDTPFAALHAAGTVSYTHLDVYKRQTSSFLASAPPALPSPPGGCSPACLYIASPSFMEACASVLALAVIASASLPLSASLRSAMAFSIARRSASPTLEPCSASVFSVECTSASAWFLASTSALRFLSSSACASASLTIFWMSASERPPDAWMRICCSLPVRCV